MNDQAGIMSAGQTAQESSPFDVEFFMVQGMGFRCMGYLDCKGQWRCAFNHVELPGTIWVTE